MKLKKGMIIDNAGGEFIAVATGEASKSFNGLIRNNKTANFLFQQLMTDKSEQQLVDALLTKYDVTEEVARADVRRLLGQLKEVGLLEQ